MKYIKLITALILCISIIILPSCTKIGNISSSDSVLKIGLPYTEGNFNPFYSSNEYDLEVVAQMFRPIQRRGSDNKLINHSGGISYEFVGENKVKYTVSIKDDLFFSDGTNITIDDVISFYHYVSDASYNGTYSDFYLNDIDGLKEYYFDDKNYEKSLAEIENKISSQYSLTTISDEKYIEYLIETKLEGKYNGNIDSSSPYNKSWKEYILDSSNGYKLSKLGDNATESDILKLLAEIEIESNRFVYNPENYYREKLFSEYINGNYSDGINVSSISGIKKVNDYTCTVLFNSKNINDISQLNVILVPTDYLFAEYVKGTAANVAEIQNIAISSGPYVLNDYNEKEIVMSANKYYSEGHGEFANLRFIIVDDLVKALNSGKVDIISTDATSDVINKINKENYVYSVTNNPSYVSLFFNTRSLDEYARKSLMCLCSSVVSIEDVIGPYYTKLYTPMSIRFSENPLASSIEGYDHTTLTLNQLLSKTFTNLKAYFNGTEEDINYIALDNLKTVLNEKGVNLEIILCDEETLEVAISSGEADIWIGETPDGPTCDRFDDYNSTSSKNKTAVNNSLIDELTLKIRSAVGFTDKKKLTKDLMEAVLSNAIEYPLYQLQTVTVYNTDTINEAAINENKNHDGFTYIIPWLSQQKG